MENRLFALVCLLWGSTWMFIKIGVTYFPPITFGAFRYTIGGIFLYIVMKIYKLPFPTKWEDIKPAVVFGMLNGLSGAFLFWGGQFLSSTLTSMINTVTPFFMAIFAYVLIKDKMTKHKLLGLFLGFIGILIILSGDSEIYVSSYWGAGAIVLQAALYAFAATYSKKYRVGIKPMQVVTVQLLTAGLELSILAMVFERNKPIVFCPASIASIIYLSIFGGAIAFLIYYYLLTKIDVTKLSYVSFFTPIIAAIEGVLFLKEPVTFKMMLGLALTLVGAYVINVMPPLPSEENQEG